MKILHICLSSHYTEGMTYQDNQLPDQNAADGHDVLVVSDCYKYQGSNLIETEEEEKTLESGVRLIRFKYDRVVNELISSKVKKVKKLKSLLVKEKPDVILFHGVTGWEMLTVANYKKNNPSTKLYIDSHQDFHNSGTSWFSLFFQYKIFNNYLVGKVRNYVDKFLYLSYESREFIVKMYSLKNSELEFYPLGGNVVNKNDKTMFSEGVRQKHNYAFDDILIVHSGKLVAAKKTKELIQAFSKVKSDKIKLLIIGAIPDQEKAILEPLILADSRVSFLGWKGSDELPKYLCAADIYFQPGTQSATMQNAICCGTPVALYPYPSHEPYLKGNGFFVENEDDYISVFNKIIAEPEILKTMSDNSYSVAEELLDYRKLAARLYV